MIACLLNVLLVPGIGVSASTHQASAHDVFPQQDPDRGPKQRAELVLSIEATITELRAPISELNRSVQNLVLPGRRVRPLFASIVRVVDVARPLQERRSVLELDALSSKRTLTRPESRRREDLALWSGFLDEVHYFESAGFYSIKGSFGADDATLFRSPTGFKARARLKDESLAWVRATLDLDWRRAGKEWQLESFITRSFDVMRTPEPLFADVTAAALSPSDLVRAQRSKRDEFLIDWVRGIRAGEVELDQFMKGLIGSLEDGSFQGNWAHTAVVDFDRDGWDDVYVMPHNARAMAFRNRGDGRFEEIGGRLGLGLEGVHGAVFADFDNDGDDDAVLSFFPGETKVFENAKGVYTVKQRGLPSLALALTTVDYDGDGLLDLYLGRYNGLLLEAMAAARERKRRGGEQRPPDFPGMSKEESREVALRLATSGEPFVNIPGPPNVLLRNVGGGRFERARGAGPAEPYYQTMAAVWSDIDGDGDPDLYVVNEGGPNQLVRNDGSGRFVDITDAAARDVGFGMGATFGDYDEDGRLDLYVTNMYSKAGQRIAEIMRSDARVRGAARGNSLLRNTGTGFEFVAGSVVEAADFGWGGIFFDANNDGALDIYAPAGYVTMPREVASTGDA